MLRYFAHGVPSILSDVPFGEPALWVGRLDQAMAEFQPFDEQFMMRGAIGVTYVLDQWFDLIDPARTWLDVFAHALKHPPEWWRTNPIYEESFLTGILVEWLRAKPHEALPMLQDLMNVDGTRLFAYGVLSEYASPDDPRYALSPEMIRAVGEDLSRQGVTDEVATEALNILTASEDAEARALLKVLVSQITPEMIQARQEMRALGLERRSEADRP